MDPNAAAFDPYRGMGQQPQQQQQQQQMSQYMQQMQQMGMTPQMMQQMQQQQYAMQMQYMRQQQMQGMGGMGQPTAAGMSPQQMTQQGMGQTAMGHPAMGQTAMPAPTAAMPQMQGMSPHHQAQLHAAAAGGPPMETQTLGVFLEEIAFFMEDMKKDLWWLIRAAHQPTPIGVVRGEEELQPVAPNVEALIQALQVRTDGHIEKHNNQVRSKIVIVPNVSPEERSVLHALRKLTFNCLGKIEVFGGLFLLEGSNSQIWQGYHKFVASIEPQWMVPSDSAISKPYFTQCCVVCPVYVDRKKKEIQMFNIYCPKRYWAFPGGDILRGTDRNLFDTARRRFKDEVGAFFGREWNEVFVTDLPQDGVAVQDFRHPSVCIYIHLEKDGVRYPTRPHFFVEVTEEFYAASRCYERDSSGIIRLPQPEGPCVRYDDLASAPNVHLQGHRFLPHDEARWVSLEYQTGKLTWEDDRRAMRKEQQELFRSMPEKVWDWFSEISGLEPVVRSSLLPTDFPTDGPFVVRMSGIDKLASDDDIRKFFENSNIEVKAVEQFEEPRHTARAEFHDREALEQALQLTNNKLHRRSVRIEIWAEAGSGFAQSVAAVGTASLKPYEGPLPDSPPFKVIIRSVDKSVDRDELGYFFWDRGCEVSDLEYPLKGERHAGVVQFKDQESLRKALGLNRAVFKGREVTIELIIGNSIPRAPGGSSGGGGGSSRSGGGGGGGGKGKGKKGGGKGDSFGGGRRDREEREPPSRSDFGTSRPVLNLKARSKPLPGEPGYREEESSSRPGGRPDPFGGARPVDRRPTRADNDENWRR